MTYLIVAVLVGVLAALGCVWFGFWLGRLLPDEKPSPQVLEPRLGSNILDASEYPAEAD